MPNSIPRLQVLIGAPGSGKSTWCKKRQMERPEEVILSIDAVRARVGTGEADQSATPEAVALVHREAAVALRRGQSVTIDATGATARQRSDWLQLASDYQAQPTATVFRVPLKVCLRRNNHRDRTVPEQVLASMWHAIKRTRRRDLLREGFASVDELTG